MIEPTDEMRMVAYRAARKWAAAHGDAQPDDRMIDDALAAVLAIVERDYDVDRKLPPVEHRMRRDLWWNHYAEHYEAECICGESFAHGVRKEAADRLLDHLYVTRTGD